MKIPLNLLLLLRPIKEIIANIHKQRIGKITINKINYLTKSKHLCDLFIYFSHISVFMVKTFTRSELLVLKEIVENNDIVITIAKNLKKTKSQIYRILSSLLEKELITKNKKNYQLTKTKHTFILNNLIKNSKLIEYLTGSQIFILIDLLSEKTIKEVCNNTRLSKTYVTKFVKSAYHASILFKKDKKYLINEKIYPQLVDFLKEYQIHYNSFDKRTPIGSTIYLRNEKEVLFSTKQQMNATLTSFSVFKDYNLLIYTLENFYYLPNKQLTKKDILLHTLKILEKTKDFRDRLYLALFYYKYKKEFKDIKHEILDNLNKIFTGEKIDRYPPLKEIKEKAKVYNIKM